MVLDTRKEFFTIKDVSRCLDIKLRDRFRVLLLRKGISQNQLSDEVGISKGTMSKIVNEDWLPTSQIKLRIAKILDCDSLVIFGAMGYWSEWRNKIGYPTKEGEDEKS